MPNVKLTRFRVVSDERLAYCIHDQAHGGPGAGFCVLSPACPGPHPCVDCALAYAGVKTREMVAVGEELARAMARNGAALAAKVASRRALRVIG